MKPTISTGACTSSTSACATSSMCWPEPTEQRAAAVAGGAQQHARDLLEAPADGADVDDREDQRPVEDVVARYCSPLTTA
jgi:hypothetical protein